MSEPRKPYIIPGQSNARQFVANSDMSDEGKARMLESMENIDRDTDAIVRNDVRQIGVNGGLQGKPLEQWTDAAVKNVDKGGYIGGMSRIVPQSSTPTPTQAPATTTYDDMYAQLLKAQMEAQQKESAELRRHGRTQQMIGGITDAANALASMYNTTRGAAPTYDPRQSLDGKALARYDRAKAEMDKEHAKQMAYIQQLRNGELQSQQLKNAARRLGLQGADQLRKINNADFARYKFDLQNDLSNRKLDAQIARDEALALYRQSVISLGQYRELVRMTDMKNKASGAYDKDYTEVTVKDIVDGKEVTTKERMNKKGGGRRPNPMKNTNGKEPNPIG